MSLRALRASVVGTESYEARLAQCVLGGGPDASQAAMTLLEYRDPCTLDAAVTLVANQGTVSDDAFNCVADAWETYRHLRNLGWD